MYALVDCNNFYASCERVFRPDLNGKPIVVLSNNDGCVIARSNEAKVLGIPMAAPAFKFQELFDRNNVSVFSANFALYGDMSSRIMSILSEEAPEIEIYSIDEAFINYTDFQNFDYREHGLHLLNRVKMSTGVPISVGFAPTKSLAKVANKIAKKYAKETSGVYVIDSEEKRIKALKWLPVEDVWGIGRAHTKRLLKIGVKRAYDFTQLSEDWIKKNMAVVGLRLKQDLEGNETITLDEVKAKKNIATTRTFEKNYLQIGEIEERVTTFAVSCAEKLRKQNSNCNALLVFVHTNPHRDDLAQYMRNIVINLPYPTNSSIELAKYAQIGLSKIFKEGYYYKKAGVIAMDITPESPTQISMFENSNPKHKSAMNAIDTITKLYGSRKVKLASQDFQRTWKMRQEKLSPRYTTSLNEIITISA